MHLLGIGPTGVGKSNFAVWRSLEHARARMSFTFVFPHDPPAETLIAELYARFKGGIGNRLIVDEVGDMQHVIMQPFILFSTATSYYDRKLENALYAERALEPCEAMLADGSSLEDTPAKAKYARFGIAAWQEARGNGAYISESDMPNILIKNHPAQKKAMANCKDPALIRGFQVLQALAQKDYTSMVESAIRFLEVVYQSAVVEAKTSKPPVVDWPAFFSKGGIHIITKGKASKHQFRTAVRADFLHKFRAAMDGKMPPHYYKMDEVNNYGLVGDFEAEALSTSRFRSFYLEQYTQLLDYPTDKITDNVVTNSDIVLFRQSHPDMQEFAARQLRAILDRNKVHHKDQNFRQVHDGFDEVKRITQGESVSEKGGKTTSENVGIQMVAKYREVTQEKPVYESPNDQVFWQAQEIGELKQGEFYYKPLHGTPERKRVPLVRPSFFQHTVKAKLQECMTLLHSRPPYEIPIPPEATMPSVGNESNSPSKNLPKPQGRRATSLN